MSNVFQERGEQLAETVKDFLKTPEFKKWVLPPLILLTVLLLAAYVIFWMPNTFDTDEKVLIVSRGATFKTVMDSLEAAGVIRSRLTFEFAGRILGYTTSVKVGKYVFRSGVSNSELLRDLRYGESRNLIPVSIPEGTRMTGIMRRIAQTLGVNESELVALCSDSAFIGSLGLDVPNLEGYLLPDTYYFHWQTDEREILTRLVTAFVGFYDDRLKDRQREMKMTMHEVVTLASIVEGEAVIDSERATIAGVYHNRLKKRMRLEADPTIQYILADGPRRLFYRDLRVNSPYNTYLNYGLPPGPINNPGRQSIIAVLYPENHDYLFFVADGQGGHRFSKTYGEHQRHVKTFRRFRREMQKHSQIGGG
ncbi:MAG TPA: endolytic transglycosylase MltG [Bacteroidota bacterium]|nr:endolytic transglycosylase MltG [Bacteroidota bacterium]